MAFDDVPSGVSEVKGKPKEGESSFNSDIETLLDSNPLSIAMQDKETERDQRHCL